MNNKNGYVWWITIRNATYLVASPSRTAIMLDTHFGKLLDMQVVANGYSAYNSFPVKQRRWVHILCKAEKYMVRKGGSYLSCYRRLLAIYKRIKSMESVRCAECLDLERAVLEIASAY